VVTAWEDDAWKPAPRTHQGLVTGWDIGSGVFRGGMFGARCETYSCRVTHPTKRIVVPPVHVLVQTRRVCEPGRGDVRCGRVGTRGDGVGG
jgi:hypothetical protein